MTGNVVSHQYVCPFVISPSATERFKHIYITETKICHGGYLNGYIAFQASFTREKMWVPVLTAQTKVTVNS